MGSATHAELLSTIELMKTVLRIAAQERDSRQQRVDTPDGPEMAWVLFEREAMTSWVNLLREQRGLPPVAEAEVARVERQAAGHIDYAEKYALYCAELAIGAG